MDKAIGVMEASVATATGHDKEGFVNGTANVKESRTEAAGHAEEVITGVKRKASDTELSIHQDRHADYQWNKLSSRQRARLIATDITKI